MCVCFCSRHEYTCTNSVGAWDPWLKQFWMYTKEITTWTGASEQPMLKQGTIRKEPKMSAESRFTKLRWALTVIGLVLYVVDIVSDAFLGAKYLYDGHVTWGVLTFLFVLCASVCTQIFSYRWFSDDKSEPSGDDAKVSCVSWDFITGLHILQMGIFTRYFQLLRSSFRVLRSKCASGDSEARVHRGLFGQATDLSMLRLFEAFLESVPQLLLQLYIVLLGHGHISVLQFISMVASFFNVSWAMVDYRRCHRRSLPHLSEMQGLATAVYLLYKLSTISTRVFSLSLLLALSPLNLASMALVWLMATAWAFSLRTDFCTSRALEWLYRAVVGAILLFSFFNVKGENTRVPMTVYYVVYALQSLSAPLQLYAFGPDVLRLEYGLAAILAGLCVGLSMLGVYYSLLHQREEAGTRVADEVDGLERQEEGLDTSPRIRRFLQI
ncbi:hypothetical protein ACEWY4_018485 [Coilia grayii]|uniref:XK-related protein n=1 Tax=Coilia grayii TaxID=363190 RepID=A0ABD1JEZ9_9TELE